MLIKPEDKHYAHMIWASQMLDGLLDQYNTQQIKGSLEIIHTHQSHLFLSIIGKLLLINLEIKCN